MINFSSLQRFNFDRALASEVFFVEDHDSLALLLAALGHDAGHRGRNNGFEVGRLSELAIRYNDLSVLESHHASVTCTLIHTTGLLHGVDKEVAKKIKSTIIYSILQTDMAKHSSNVEWLKQQQPFGERAPDSATSKELVSCILHAADIGHPVASSEQYF